MKVVLFTYIAVLTALCMFAIGSGANCANKNKELIAELKRYDLAYNHISENKIIDGSTEENIAKFYELVEVYNELKRNVIVVEKGDTIAYIKFDDVTFDGSYVQKLYEQFDKPEGFISEINSVYGTNFKNLYIESK